MIKHAIEKIRLFFFEINDIITSAKEFQKEVLQDLEQEEKEAS